LRVGESVVLKICHSNAHNLSLNQTNTNTAQKHLSIVAENTPQLPLIADPPQTLSSPTQAPDIKHTDTKYSNTKHTDTKTKT
jgi:hypothetical protein